MPWHVTAIQSYWPLMTLTKPFSAVCALPSLPLPKPPRRFGRPHRCHYFMLQTRRLSLVCPLGSVESINEGKENKQHPLLDNSLIMLQRLASCPCKRYISFQKKGTILFIESLEWDVELGCKMAACLHFPPSLRVKNGNERRISENETRTLQRESLSSL